MNFVFLVNKTYLNIMLALKQLKALLYDSLPFSLSFTMKIK